MSNPQPQVIRQAGPSQNAELSQIATAFSSEMRQHRQQRHDMRMDDINNKMGFASQIVEQYYGDIGTAMKEHPDIFRDLFDDVYDGDEVAAGLAFKNLSETPPQGQQMFLQGIDENIRNNITADVAIRNNLEALHAPNIGEEVLVRGDGESLHPEFPFRSPEDTTPQQPTADGEATSEGQPDAETSSPYSLNIDTTNLRRVGDPEEPTDADTGEPAVRGNIYEPPSDTEGIAAQQREISSRIEEVRQRNPEEAARMQEYLNNLNDYGTELAQYENAYAEWREAQNASEDTGDAVNERAALFRRKDEINEEMANAPGARQQVLSQELNQIEGRINSIGQRMERERAASQNQPEAPTPPKALNMAEGPERGAPTGSPEALTPAQRRSLSEQQEQQRPWERTQGVDNAFRARRGEETTVIGGIRDAYRNIPQGPAQHFQNNEEAPTGPQSGRATLEEVSESARTRGVQGVNETTRRNHNQAEQEVVTEQSLPDPETGEPGRQRDYLANLVLDGPLTLSPRDQRRFQRDSNNDLRDIRRQFRVNPELNSSEATQERYATLARALNWMEDPANAEMRAAVEPVAMREEREAAFRRRYDTARLEHDVKTINAQLDIERAKLKLSDAELQLRLADVNAAAETALQDMPDAIKKHYDFHAGLMDDMHARIVEEYGDNPAQLERKLTELYASPAWQASLKTTSEIVYRYTGTPVDLTEAAQETGGLFRKLYDWVTGGGGDPETFMRDSTFQDARQPNAINTPLTIPNDLGSVPSQSSYENSASNFMRSQGLGEQ